MRLLKSLLMSFGQNVLLAVSDARGVAQRVGGTASRPSISIRLGSGPVPGLRRRAGVIPDVSEVHHGRPGITPSNNL